MIISLDSHYSCAVNNCPFKFECAQHTTAGDLRVDDGFTPELTRENNGEISCKTIHQPFLEAVRYTCLPANVYTLGRGYLSRKQIKSIMSPQTINDLQMSGF